MPKLDEIAEAGYDAYVERVPGAGVGPFPTTDAHTKTLARHVAMAVLDAAGPLTDLDIAQLRAELLSS